MTSSQSPHQDAGPPGRSAGPAPASARPNGDTARQRRFLLALAGVVVLVILGAFLWWLRARNYESTDDAYIDARLVHPAPQIAGRVLEVHVSDNVRVHAGEVLVELDPADVRARYRQAQAQAAQAQAQLDEARAQIRVDDASLAQARASLAGMRAQAAHAARDLARYRGLEQTMPAAVAGAQLDQVRTSALSLAAQRDASATQVDGAQRRVAAAQTQAAGADAQLKTAQAQLEQARLNLGYTRITAPIDGTVAQQSVAVGNYVQPGQELLAIVPLEVWVTANFKETQLALMRPGQRVDLRIDAYPDVHFTGHVDSIQRGAGQAFSLLPAQNATGNFVKVVQRVPVKIVIDGPLDERYVLGPGMSVYPTVHVR